MKPIALVTGAGEGIGRTIALELAAGGYKVIAVDIDGAAARETERLVASGRGIANSFELDVSIDADVAELAASIQSQHGPLDVLVNKATIQVNATVERTSDAEFRREMNVNVGAVDPAAAHIAAGGLHALGRIGTPEEVARAERFLARPAASFITGAEVVADGV